MTEIETRLRKAIAQAAGRGFEWFDLKSSRGDSNCPHPVTYHPKDGHGYEREAVYFDVSAGEVGFFEDEIDNEDVLVTLCRAFESFPDIKDREAIGNK